MSPDPERIPRPLEVLRQEHRAMERVLDVLDVLLAREQAGEGFEARDFAHCVDFFREYIDACHREREEKIMKPPGSTTSRGIVGERFHEHAVVQRLLRSLVRSLEAPPENDPVARARFLETARAYGAAQRQHMEKEEETLGALYEQPLTPEQEEAQLSELCDPSCSVSEERRRELERLAGELGERWLDTREPNGS